MGSSKKKKNETPPETSARVVSAELPFDPNDEGLPRGLRRFGARLAEFQKKLDESRNAPAGDVAGPYHRHPHLAKAMPGHRLHKAGGRTPLFNLQALARIERGTRADRSAFDALLGDIKRLEDTIGDIDYWWVFLEASEKKGLPREIVAWAANKHAQACGRLEGWLAAGNWVDHKYLGDLDTVSLRTRVLGEALLEQSWPGRKKERKKLGAYLVARLRKVHASALALDMNDLEGGLHEVRRKLRWFSIYPRAVEGLVVLDESAPAPEGWGRYLTESILSSPFSKLPPAEQGVEPIAIPAPLFYALSWIIDDLGRVKDAAQETEFVENGLHATHQPGDPAQWLGDRAISHEAAGTHAREVIAQTIEKDRLLLRLADAIEAQL